MRLLNPDYQIHVLLFFTTSAFDTYADPLNVDFPHFLTERVMENKIVHVYQIVHHLETPEPHEFRPQTSDKPLQSHIYISNLALPRKNCQTRNVY